LTSFSIAALLWERRMCRLIILLTLSACDRVAGQLPRDLSVNDQPLTAFDLSCVGFSAQPQLVPASLIVLLDDSGSMGDGTHGDPKLKWQPVTAALTAFFQDPASLGLSASLQYFPLSDVCTADAYAIPTVELRPLPDLSFATSLAAQTPAGSRPTLPAVTGAIKYAQEALLNDSMSRVAIVLVTDGDPDVCDTSVADVAMQLSTAALQIPTYVIGVGNGIPSWSQLAMAGGTGSPTLVAVGDPDTTRMQLLAALDAIRGLNLSCDLPIPAAPAGMTIDFKQVNLTFTPSTGGEGVLWPYDKDCSGSQPAWRYDDPNQPRDVVLCPPACSAARRDPQGAIQVLFGCGTFGAS
jgi:hypothetical protein